MCDALHFRAPTLTLITAKRGHAACNYIAHYAAMLLTLRAELYMDHGMGIPTGVSSLLWQQWSIWRMKCCL